MNLVRIYRIFYILSKNHYLCGPLYDRNIIFFLINSLGIIYIDYCWKVREIAWTAFSSLFDRPSPIRHLFTTRPDKAKSLNRWHIKRGHAFKIMAYPRSTLVSRSQTVTHPFRVKYKLIRQFHPQHNDVVSLTIEVRKILLYRKTF